MSHAKDIDYLDQREHVRFETDLPVEIWNDWGERGRGRVTNLSEAGLALEVEGDQLSLVYPVFHGRNSEQEVMIGLQMGLLEGAETVSAPWLEFCCSRVYVVRKGHNRFQVGLRFAVLDHTTAAQLEHFIKGLDER